MLSNSELLAKFGNWLSPGDIAGALSKLLRVPEVWDQMHAPYFLERIFHDRIEPNLSLSNLVRIRNQISASEGDPFDSLEELEGRIDDLVLEIERIPPKSREFKHIAILALYLQMKLTTDHEELLERIQSNPRCWSSALACSWSEIGDQSLLAASLLNSDREVDVLAVVNALLANLDIEDAAAAMLRVAGGTLPQRLFPPVSSREPDLVSRVIEMASAQPQVSSETPTGSMNSLMLNAYIARQNGDFDFANRILQDAQSTSDRINASISDQCAEIARSMGDEELELQARQNALGFSPSPQRRASLSLLLINMDLEEEARRVLDPGSEAIEEKIVLGFLSKRAGNSDQASEYFRDAAVRLEDQFLEDIGWTQLLFDELRQNGELHTALRVACFRNQIVGANPQYRTQLARLLLEAGDPDSAAEHAHIAYALSPNSPEGRKVLAQSLHDSGSHSAALAHWSVLAETDHSAILPVARCALESGFTDLAIHTADSLLTNERYAPDAQLILGEAYRSNGDLRRAVEFFENITQETPQHPKAWIALAECLDAIGDHELAAHTIETGIQMNPNDAELLHARASWLEGEGRLSEALDSAESAYGLEPKGIEIQITYGDLLRKLGHYEQSLAILEKAIAQKPFHWKALNILAQVQAECGDYEQALKTISSLPRTAGPEAHFTAGALTIRVSQQKGDKDLAAKGIAHLESSKEGGFDHPTFNHWLGVAYETTDQSGKAYEAYQASLKSLTDEEYELILESKVGLGRSALAVGQTTLATSLLEDTQLRNQQSVPLFVTLSQAYLEDQKHAKAFDAAVQALHIDPNDQRGIQQITKVASEAENWAPAMQAMKTLVEVKPLDPSAWITYAESASLAKNMDETRRALAQALIHGRNKTSILLEAARLMVVNDLPRSAIRTIQRAINIEPDLPEVQRALAQAYEAAGDSSSAQRAWMRCVELDPTDVTTLDKAAGAQWKLGLRMAALDLWGKAHQIDPEYLRMHFTLASAHAAQGDLDSALEFLKLARKKSTGDIEMTLKSARLALDLGEASFAIDSITDMLRQAPTRNDLLLTLAEIYLALGKDQKAADVLESIIIEPTPPDCWHAISAISALRAGEVKRASTYFKAGLKREQISSRDRILMTRVGLALGQWRQALQLVNKPVEEATWQLNLARATTRIRIHELSEIFDLANVVTHNPIHALAIMDDQPRIEEVIDSAIRNLAPKHDVEQAKIRYGLLSNSADTTLWNDALLALQSRPSLPLLEGLVIASLKIGQYRQAVETIALRDDLGIESEWLDLLAGIAQRALGQVSASVKSFQLAEKNPTLLPLSKYFSAKSLISLEERERAIEYLQAAIAAWPDEGKWQFQLGKVLTLDGDLDTALPHLQEAAELSPSNLEYKMALAKALKKSGHLSQAYEGFKLALESMPSDGALWLETGRLALGIGESSGAMRYFQRACELLPSEPAAFSGAAKAALAMDDAKSATKWVRTAMRLSPQNPEVLVTLGEILAKQGKVEKALQSYEMAIPKVEDPLPLRIARTRLLLQANQPAQALEEMRALADLHPENESIWAAYAEVCEAGGHMAEGIEAANRASKLAPNNPGYRLLLARLCRKAGQLDRALDDLSQLEQKNPTDSRVLTELGMLYEDRRQLSEALDAYQRSIACNQTSALAHFRAGVVLKQLKMYTQAGEMLRKAVEINPENPEALHQLAAVRALELVHGGIRNMAVTT